MMAGGRQSSSVFSAERQRDQRRQRRRRRDVTIIAGSTCLVGTYLCFAGPPSGGGIIRRELFASATTTTKQSTKRLQRKKKKTKGRILADGGEAAEAPPIGNIVTSTPHRQTHTLELLLGSNRSPHTFAISTGLDVPLLLPCARCNGCNACPETTDADFAGKIDDVDDLHTCYDPAASKNAAFTECSTCPHQCGTNTGGMCVSTSTIGSTITNEKGFVQDGTYTAMEVTDVATLLFNQADNSFYSRSSANKIGKKDSVTLPLAIDCLSQAEGFAAQNLGGYGDVDGDGDEKDDARWRGAGLVSMSAAPTSFLSMLVEEGIISNRRFGLCFDKMSFGVVLSDEDREADGIADDRMGRNDNVVSLGDVDRAHHVTPLVFARNSALKRENQNNQETTTKASYAVRLRKVYLRQGDIESAASIGDGPVPSLASIGNDYGEDATVYALDQVDYERINGGVNGSLPGVSVDTELSYTYFDRTLEKDFIGAFEDMSGRKFSYLGMKLTNEEVRTLPTVLLQFEADNAEQTGVDPSTIPGLAAYRNLDTQHPFDVVIAIPPSHYLKYDHTTDRFSIKFFVSIEDPSGISRLGSNIFQGHEVLFDVDEGRIGFAEHDGCVDGGVLDSTDTGVRLFSTSDRSSGSPSITDSFVSSVSSFFGTDDAESSLSPVESRTDVPTIASPRSLVAPTTSSNALWAVIGSICFLLGIGVVLAVDRLMERRARANDDVASEGGTSEINTIESGDRSIGASIPKRSIRDIFDYQKEMRGGVQSVGVSDLELEQERMRASLTSVASGEGSRRSVGDGGQQRASFGASRTLRWKLDH